MQWEIWNAKLENLVAGAGSPEGEVGLRKWEVGTGCLPQAARKALLPGGKSGGRAVFRRAFPISSSKSLLFLGLGVLRGG